MNAFVARVLVAGFLTVFMRALCGLYEMAVRSISNPYAMTNTSVCSSTERHGSANGWIISISSTTRS
jgi:hypothetical protein